MHSRADDFFHLWKGVLWNKVLLLSKKSPYCFRSERYAHIDAANQVAKEEYLNEQDLREWQEFVDEKTRCMSNYSGD